ncbi:MAG: beta-galactosidase [Treponema sp.]|nr:beta-galactosidase [Treponema sp.]
MTGSSESGGSLPRFLLHGADYNYEQWLDFPDVLDSDLVLMRETGVNVLAVGIFSWSRLESNEGVYSFDWLDNCFDHLYKNGQKIILATPSGSKPVWLSQKYPEVCQMTASGVRHPHSGRHNHCRTSVKYREACVKINTKLAQRYGTHPALILWHVSNEYNGMPCFCPQCIAAFRTWLENRYKTIDTLNAAWYTDFWSHRFTSWQQIFPADPSIHGLMLDWQRFSSDQCIDFFHAESEPLRRITPDVPVTTNFQKPDVGLDYHKFAQHVDIVCWDNYPEWHRTGDDESAAIKTGFLHDLCYSYLGKPFLMMESSPGAVNWQGVSKKKRKGMHTLSSMQAVAHGSDSVQYFQWRQSRGGIEKFHDAVVTHFGTNDTRIFREVAETGSLLKKLASIAGTVKNAQAAVVYDIQNGWALDNAQLPLNIEKNYQEECIAHYGAFWKMGVPCDVIGAQYIDYSRYRIIVLPMLYMLREETAEKIRRFTEQGGVVVAAFLTGIVNESDLCYLGGTPGKLTDVFGLAVEETETIAEYENLVFKMYGQSWKAFHYSDRVRLGGAQALGKFEKPEDGFPAVTSYKYKEGTAYYICARTEQNFLSKFYKELCIKHDVFPCVPWEIPAGVSVQKRADAIFVMNFNSHEIDISVNEKKYYSFLGGEAVGSKITLAPYDLIIITDKKA